MFRVFMPKLYTSRDTNSRHSRLSLFERVSRLRFVLGVVFHSLSESKFMCIFIYGGGHIDVGNVRIAADIHFEKMHSKDIQYAKCGSLNNMEIMSKIKVLIIKQLKLLEYIMFTKYMYQQEVTNLSSQIRCSNRAESRYQLANHLFSIHTFQVPTDHSTLSLRT